MQRGWRICTPQQLLLTRGDCATGWRAVINPRERRCEGFLASVFYRFQDMLSLWELHFESSFLPFCDFLFLCVEWWPSYFLLLWLTPLAKSNLGGGGKELNLALFHRLASSPSWRRPGQEPKAGNLEAWSNSSTDLGGLLIISLCLMAHRTHVCSEVTASTVSWTSHIYSSVKKKMPHRFAYRPVWCAYRHNWCSPFANDSRLRQAGGKLTITDG